MFTLGRLATRTSQPQGRAELAVDGFVAAFVAGDDALSARVIGGARTATQRGLTVPVVLASAQVTPFGVAVTPSWSVVLRVRHDSAQGAYPYFLGISGAANPVAWAIRHASFAGRMTWYDGTGIVDSGLNIGVGETATIGLTYDATTGRYAWYKNGVVGATFIGANTGSGQWQFAAPLSEGSTNSVELLAISRVCIAAARMRTLTANPWQIFKPDPRQAWAPAVAAGAGLTLAPGKGAQALTGKQPAVARTTSAVVAPARGALALVGKTPVLAQTANAEAAPGKCVLALSGKTPILGRTANSTVQPAKCALALSGKIPAATQSASGTIQPLKGALALTGREPAVAQGAKRVVAPAGGSLALAGKQPSGAQGASGTFAPMAGRLTLTGRVPSVSQTQNQTVAPMAGRAQYTGYAPAITQTAHRIIASSGAHLALAGRAPIVTQAGLGVGGGASAADIWGFVLPNGRPAGETLAELHAMMLDLHLIHGLHLGDPLMVTPSTRTAGSITQSITTSAETVTVSRA